jgi:ATP-dependent Clp protease ATP-binding subunit ClpC
MEKHNVSRLIGAPPGYVGYEEGGQLTEKIRRRPYAVVLLDEIEKAHPDVFNMLLQIMEEGHLTDSFGRKVDFKNVVLIMTTNAGASGMAHGGPFGFGKADEDTNYEKMKTNLMHDIQREFKPEFLGRLDEVVVFRKLTREELKRIVDIELSKVRERLGERGLKIVLTDEARTFIIDKGEADGGLDYGARPLRRSVERFIEDPLSEELLRGAFEGQNLITVKVKEVGDQKQLEFAGSTVEPEEEKELATVGDESSK